MLTRNRRKFLPQAIQCYQRQTYPNRELLIVSDGQDVRDLVPADDSIRLLQVEEGRNIGEKRNFGAARAAGEIIAHFDDDDYSDPNRLSDQIRRLLVFDKAVTGYHTMRFTDGVGWWEYRHGGRYSLGTALCYRKDWWQRHPFPAKQVAEDSEFVDVARQHEQIIAVDAGDWMFARVHPGNTSPKSLRGDNWRRLNV